jgi:hypothetical protein
MAKRVRVVSPRGDNKPQPPKPQPVRNPVQPVRPPKPPPMRNPTISRRPIRQPGR